VFAVAGWDVGVCGRLRVSVSAAGAGDVVSGLCGVVVGWGWYAAVGSGVDGFGCPVEGDSWPCGARGDAPGPVSVGLSDG
jgi:hypothetical protein